MFTVALYVAVIVSTVWGSGEVTFTHHPKSVYFKGNEIVDQSFLKEIFSASVGFTTSQDSDWSGLRISNPFHYAEAIVVLVIDGIETLDGIKGHHFTLNTDEDEDLTWLTMERRVRSRFPSQNNTLMRIELSEGVDAVAPFYHLFGETEISTLPSAQFLDMNATEDREFVSEVTLLQEIINKVERGSVSRDGIPDIYWFVLRGLHAVWDLHGDESLATGEAKQLLLNTIGEMNSAFKKAYDGRVLTSVITSDVSHTRRVRRQAESPAPAAPAAPAGGTEPAAPAAAPADAAAAAPPAPAPAPAPAADSSGTGAKPGNLASDYDENWPVIFNIILWFMVVFVWSLIAICVTVMQMDPGRDSIIYRMTTMKTMKKEN